MTRSRVLRERCVCTTCLHPTDGLQCCNSCRSSLNVGPEKPMDAVDGINVQSPVAHELKVPGSEIHSFGLDQSSKACEYDE